MSGVDEICGHKSLGEVKVQFLRDVSNVLTDMNNQCN